MSGPNFDGSRGQTAIALPPRLSTLAKISKAEKIDVLVDNGLCFAVDKDKAAIARPCYHAPPETLLQWLDQ